jgi:hypothetical protein
VQHHEDYYVSIPHVCVSQTADTSYVTQAPPQYEYAYAVKDEHTKDIKQHKESRHGDRTEGEYSFLEADGTTRIVKYFVDGKSGFVAQVLREGHAVHAAPAQRVVAAPVFAKVAAPVAVHAAPVAVHAAPVAFAAPAARYGLANSFQNSNVLRGQAGYRVGNFAGNFGGNFGGNIGAGNYGHGASSFVGASNFGGNFGNNQRAGHY